MSPDKTPREAKAMTAAQQGRTTTPFSKADKIVSGVLCDAWDAADERGDFVAAEALKRALTHLGLPWVRLGG